MKKDSVKGIINIEIDRWSAIYATMRLQSHILDKLISRLAFVSSFCDMRGEEFVLDISVIDFGAGDDGKTDASYAFIEAWTVACSSDIPTTIFVPSKRIHAPEESPNTDGIHVEQSFNIRILNIGMRTGDDYCVSIGPGTKDLWIQYVVCGPGMT
ncbi:hypothetical protein IFM89_026378 [Coptis chinensis]|uniref:Uncharacterized protein n=1 Tax=Coptis chinensis TaxID=261450 RepID=A0A835IG28_9MAGN|nr:hypothetical protein IFM89_026378 [Coptis chinensis]